VKKGAEEMISDPMKRKIPTIGGEIRDCSGSGPA